MAANRPVSYNKPSRRQALLEIRRLIVEEGLSHQEIQLRLSIPSRTYFHWLDLLFKTEQEVIEGNNYTHQRLLNESLILGQRYLRRARKLTEIGDDKTMDVEQRIEAHKSAAQLERAVHDISYMAPSYLRRQGLLPMNGSKGSSPVLTMSKLELDEKEDPYESERIDAAGQYRREHQKQQQQQQKNKSPRELEEQEKRWR